MNETERRIQQAKAILEAIERAAEGTLVAATQADIDNIVRIYCAQLELPL